MDVAVETVVRFDDDLGDAPVVGDREGERDERRLWRYLDEVIGRDRLCGRHRVDRRALDVGELVGFGIEVRAAGADQQKTQEARNTHA